jgi:hypothetical protein
VNLNSAIRKFESSHPSHAVPLFGQCPVSRKKPRSSGALRRVLSPGDRKGSISGRFGAPVGARSPVAFLGMSAFLMADRISTIIGAQLERSARSCRLRHTDSRLAAEGTPSLSSAVNSFGGFGWRALACIAAPPPIPACLRLQPGMRVMSLPSERKR